MVFRLIVGLALFPIALGGGWWLHRRGWMTEAQASRVIRWSVQVLSPITLCLSFWQMRLTRLEPWLLPFLGAAISAATLLPALAYARRDRLTPAQTGSFLTCAFFSNLGYLGAFTAFALYGEAGYGLSMLYLTFFTPCFYTLGFGIAAHYGRGVQQSTLSSAFNGELRLYPFLGMLAGALLSLSGVPRPIPLVWLNQCLIPVNTALSLATIGSQLVLTSPRPYLRPCFVMSGIKFLFTPLVAWGLVSLCRLHGVPRAVVLLQASTPVAVSPLVLPLLFDLDRRLTNALWLFTTLVSVPWLLLVLPLLKI